MTEPQLPDEIEPKAETAVWFQLLHNEPLSMQEIHERVDHSPRQIRRVVTDLEDSDLVKTYHEPRDPKERMVAICGDTSTDASPRQ